LGELGVVSALSATEGEDGTVF
ncbi:MAG: hypothetical protein QOI41_4464, partial [Myxococcales bacterium]|nr:hypothetical protein [Myxococcales bacterium]